MNLTLVSPPQVEPVSLDEALVHCRAQNDAEDDLLEAQITAARSHAEQFLRRALIEQTWELGLDEWPKTETIELPRPPLLTVDWIRYYDPDGHEHELDDDEYIVNTRSLPGAIRLKAGAHWPHVELRATDGIVIRFVAGYGDDPADVPQDIRHAILLMVGQWYEHREEVVAGITMSELPQVSKALLWPHRCLTV